MNQITEHFHLHSHDVLIPNDKARVATIKDEKFPNTGGIKTEKSVDFLNSVFKSAAVENFRDLHFLQTKPGLRIRARSGGGDLYDLFKYVDPTFNQTIDDKIRSRAHISTSDRRAPHDGRMSLVYDGISIDVRVNITPNVNGQLIVCRILNQNNASKQLDDIDMTDSIRESIDLVINEPNGLFLVTGPTGSGKTTTLYAILNKLNKPSVNIITIEEPVEYINHDFHQIDVDGDAITFASALRAALRQDPDIIMIGEIRDRETAEIAVQAANTGHLVLSTLHCNNAPSAITRMLDLGVDPTTLSTALRGVTAQRLIQTIAPDAGRERCIPNEREQMWLKANNINRIEPTYPCATLTSEKFSGVTPVMEVIMTDHRIKKVLHQGEAALYEAASRQPQFETLAQAAERLAFTGKTTLEEARRIVSGQEILSITNKRIGQVLVESNKVSEADMEMVLSLQTQMHKDGKRPMIGKLLVEKKLCTQEDIIEAVGYTAEALDILQNLCISHEKKQQLDALVRKWTPGRESLFQMALDTKLVTIEELNNAKSN